MFKRSMVVLAGTVAAVGADFLMLSEFTKPAFAQTVCAPEIFGPILIEGNEYNIACDTGPASDFADLFTQQPWWLKRDVANTVVATVADGLGNPNEPIGYPFWGPFFVVNEDTEAFGSLSYYSEAYADYDIFTGVFAALHLPESVRTWAFATPTDSEPVPEPASLLGLAVIGAAAVGGALKKKAAA